MDSYDLINEKIRSLTEGIPHRISNMANTASCLFNEMEDVNWVGFYLLENETLVLGPFCGKPACITIPVGKGVCGTAVKIKQTIVVPDVEEFKGHIACDSESRSEIVIPIFKDGKVWGVLDIDSPSVGRFDDYDRKGLEKIVQTVTKNIV